VSRFSGELKRSKALIVGGYFVRDARMGLALRLQPRRSIAVGARHAGWDLDRSLGYVEWVLGDYLAHGGLSPERLSGARVLEVGPGDNLGVALRLLGLGARQVVCVDRFVTARDRDQQRTINTALIEFMPEDQRARLDPVLTPAGDIRPGQDRLVLIEGMPIEDAAERLDGEFDLIVSRAVLMHVYDLDAAMKAMTRLLVPSGAMSHKVDLSDLRLFTEGGHHPLTFLTIPDRLWDRMRRNTGLPNRLLANYYRETLEAWNYEVELLISRLIGQSELETPAPAEGLGARIEQAAPLVEEIRPRLLERFRDLPVADLAAASVFVNARKPAGGSVAIGSPA
jgi:SAM-dependent methyltransferase